MHQRAVMKSSNGAVTERDIHAIEAEHVIAPGHPQISTAERPSNFGGELQVSLCPSAEARKYANPAPLGLCAFALTSFVMSVINMHALEISTSHIGVAVALSYGGIVQLMAGMWELAVGNTFGATSFSSYGGYWIAFALISNADISSPIKENSNDNSPSEAFMGLFLMAWFIFTTIMLLCTLKSSTALFLLFFFLDMNYLLLGIAHLHAESTGTINISVQKAGGFCGILAALAAWYNAFAGIADPGNSFFAIPVGHFSWSPTRMHRIKSAREAV